MRLYSSMMILSLSFYGLLVLTLALKAFLWRAYAKLSSTQCGWIWNIPPHVMHWNASPQWERDGFFLQWYMLTKCMTWWSHNYRLWTWIWKCSKLNRCNYENEKRYSGEWYFMCVCRTLGKESDISISLHFVWNVLQSLPSLALSNSPSRPHFIGAVHLFMTRLLGGKWTHYGFLL